VPVSQSILAASGQVKPSAAELIVPWATWKTTVIRALPPVGSNSHT
jgi:hypothetical protein